MHPVTGDLRRALELVPNCQPHSYPEAQPLLTFRGVGHIIAFTFVLALGDKERFSRSCDVGC